MSNFVKQTLLVSICYLFAFFLTFWAIFPLQDKLITIEASWVSLLFLPHGVRVLTAWLYGAKSIVMLFPSALITHLYIFGWSGMEPLLFAGNLVGVLSGYAAFEFVKAVGYNFYPSDDTTMDWRKLFIVGAVASMINSSGSNLFYQTIIDASGVITSILGYLVGDIAGLLVSMVVLMFAFRQIRLRSPKVGE